MAKSSEYKGSERPFCFRVFDPATKKSFYFDAKTQADLQDWMQKIRQILADNISNISFNYGKQEFNVK